MRVAATCNCDSVIGRLVKIRRTYTEYTTVTQCSAVCACASCNVPLALCTKFQSCPAQETRTQSLLLLFPSLTHLVGCIIPSSLSSRVFDSFIHFQTLIPLPLYNFLHPNFTVRSVYIALSLCFYEVKFTSLSIPLSLSLSLSFSLAFFSLTDFLSPLSLALVYSILFALCF